MAFAELHARSAFSFLRGASSPEEMVTRAAELGMSHLALLDRDGVYGSARAHHKAQELGLRAIVGAELTMNDGSAQPVLVATRTGYQNLCQLLTMAKLRAPKGQSRIEWHELESFAEGLIALSGDEDSPLHRALAGDPASAPEVMEKLTRLFGKERVFVELQRHRVRGEARRNRQLIELAERSGLHLVASNGPGYARREGRLLQDAFTALRNHTSLDGAGLLLAANSQRHLKGREQMSGLFADMPQLIDNTQRVVDLIDFSLENLGYEFPCQVPEGRDPESFLRERTFAGARERYPKLTSEIKNQLEHELRIISKLGFCGYFLIIQDIVRFARDNGILVQGRGSAANSAVCYALGITAFDPIAGIKGRLLFERFLSEGHKSWPDIDLDLPSGDQRERVIQEMYRRFAPHGAAMTANVITYRGRSAIREMGKALSLSEDVIARFSDLYPHGDYQHTLELNEQLRRAGLPDEHPRMASLVRLYRLAYGLPRHLGQHSGGMVLCTAGLHKIVPLEPASMPGRVVVQWDKDDCEDLGIIKVDLLGLGMMAAIEDTLKMCAARGRPVDITRIPKDDPATYEMMQQADTIGVFQIESRAQMATLPRMKPKEFYDVVVEVAIIRPGPIVGNLVHPYLRRRGLPGPHECIHPMFEDILQRTLGVPLFQEQVLQMAMRIADFDGSEANELRRAISFHRSDERMKKVMKKLRDRMEAKNVEKEVQDRVEQSIRSFALYGFPESHAISFALLAYASVWFKVHRPVEFYAALLNNQPMGFYSRATLVRDAKARGIKVRPACIVHSELNCTVEADDVLRLGLNQLNGVSRHSLRRILAERKQRPWRDLDDFLLRCSLPKDERRVFASSGVLNALGHHRRSALWRVEEAREADLFSHGGISGNSDGKSALEPMSPTERLEADYHTQSLTTGPHPMAYMRGRISQVCRASDLKSMRHGQPVSISGQVICRQRPGTANGHVFISLEDETGISNAFVHSELFERLRLVITQEPFLLIKGTLQNVENVISVYALDIEALNFSAVIGSHSHDFH
ncbi:MAG: error-prone DNA polymerase [Prosthecobacter sp.]|jgi:error-prone DNA polymerase|uniref:DNA polymerase III subunit alpha n=1 Tax=Prosthecobacter sp. TaxID=1965333 RepID=UPI0019DBA0D8|nr:error-prone DNA polymerase [Prosthecobacter sp.]MBE2284121.1 error-prone DNA polymerase [Prosthecobacter sp.]